MSKKSQVTSECVEYVSQNIKRNKSLWTLRPVSFLKAKDVVLSPVPFQSPTVVSSTISEPEAPTKVAMEKETRNYSKRSMKAGNVYDMSATSRRRLRNVGKEAIKQILHCTDDQAVQVAQKRRQILFVDG